MPFLSPCLLLRRHEPVPKRHRTAVASVQWGWLALVAGAHAAGLGLLLDGPPPATAAAAPLMQVHLLAAAAPTPAGAGVRPTARELPVERRSPHRPQPASVTPARPLPTTVAAAVIPTAAASSLSAQAPAQAPSDSSLQPASSSAGREEVIAASPAPPSAPPSQRPADYLDNPAPAYPGLARRLGEEGTVLLRVHVLRSGHAREIEILATSGSPRLDQAASDAVRHWRFLPARVGEDRVDSWLRVPVVFRLRN